MNNSTGTNEESKANNRLDYDEWLKGVTPTKPAKYNEPLPLERAVVNMLSMRVLEDDSVKWEAIKKIANSFNQLGDDLEKFTKNFLFQKDLSDPYRKEAPEKIAQHMQNLIERIEETNTVLDEQRTVLGDVIVALLRNALNMLKERASDVRNAAMDENPVKLRKSYKFFENYRNKFFSELSQVLSTFANDPFARAGSDPFEKEMIEHILDALKVPAIPEGMLAKYMQMEGEDFNGDLFKKDYEFFMNIELKAYKQELEEEIRAKLEELEKQKKQWESREDAPELKEAIMKEYDYWKQMTPKKRYKQLLRLRAFELLRVSAGAKRLKPEFMYRLYSEMRYVN